MSGNIKLYFLALFQMLSEYTLPPIPGGLLEPRFWVSEGKTAPPPPTLTFV